MLQLLVYAAMQVPVGLPVDRYGPSAVILTGLIILTVAQTGFALAETYPTALAARARVGTGDGMTWICVLRLVNRWSAPRNVPPIILVVVERDVRGAAPHRHPPRFQDALHHPVQRDRVGTAVGAPRVTARRTRPRRSAGRGACSPSYGGWGCCRSGVTAARPARSSTAPSSSPASPADSRAGQGRQLRLRSALACCFSSRRSSSR